MAVSRLYILYLVNAAKVLLSGIFLTTVSGTMPNLKYACLGDTVHLFQILDFDLCNGSISLIIKKSNLIATWSYQNCIQNPTVSKEYTNRVFLNENGTIMIHNITYSDQGKYFVIQKNDRWPQKQEVNIQISEAPSKDCTPKIDRVGNKLFASLKEDEDCGRPVVTLYWKGDNGSSDIHDQIQTIVDGIESGIYTACIEGPALQCEQNLLQRNQCSSIIISRSTNGTKSTEPIHGYNGLDDLVLGINSCLLISLFLSYGIVELSKKRSGCINGTECRTPICKDCLFVPAIVINAFISISILLLVIVIQTNQRSGCTNVLESTTLICHDAYFVIVIAVSVIIGILFLLLVMVILKKQRSSYGCCKCNPTFTGKTKRKYNKKLQTQYEEQHRQKRLNTFRSPTINEDELVHRYLDSLKWIDIKELLNPVQQMDLEIYCKGHHSRVASPEQNTGLRKESARETVAGKRSVCYDARIVYYDSVETMV